MRLFILALFIFFTTNLFGQNAQNKIDSLKIILLKNIPDSSRQQVLINLSKSYYPFETDSTLIYANELLHFSENSNNKYGIAYAYKLIGDVNIYKKDYPLSLKNYEDALIYSKKAKDKNLISAINRNIIINYVKLEQPKKVIENGLPFIDYLKKNNLNKKYLATTYRWLGDAYLMINNKEKAILYYNRSVKIEQPKHKKLSLYANNTIALYNAKDYTNALSFLFPALDIIEKEKIDDISLISVINIYKILTKIYFDTEQYEKAVLSSSKLYKWSQKTKKEDYELESLSYKITALKKLEKHTEAIESSLIALRIVKEKKASKYLYHFLIGLGYEYLYSQDYNNAILCFKEAVSATKKNKNTVQVANSYASLGEAYLKDGKIRQAREAFEKSKSLFLSVKSKMTARNLLLYHGSMHIIDSLQNKFKNSLYHYTTYITIRDSLNSIDEKQKIADIELKYQTDKKNKEIEILSTQNKLKELEAEEDFIIRLSLIISSFLLLLLLVIVNNRYRIKKNAVKTIGKQKEIIEEKNNENELLIKEIHHRVKNNLQIISSLLNVHKHANLDNDKVTEVITESQNKIKSMVLIHQNLYNSNNFSKIHTSNYLKDLLNFIKDSYEQDSKKHITIKTDIESNEIPINLAVPLGLIINELVTNSYKYAFTESNQKNHVFVKFRKNVKEKTYKLEVFDNGKGMPLDFDINHIETFGLQMVKGLILQLDGDIKIQSANTGTNFNIFIKDKNVA